MRATIYESSKACARGINFYGASAFAVAAAAAAAREDHWQMWRAMLSRESVRLVSSSCKI
jgi:hypothetical protein